MLTLAGDFVESLLDCDDCDGLKRHQLDVLHAHRRLQTINRRGSTGVDFFFQRGVH